MLYQSRPNLCCFIFELLWRLLSHTISLSRCKMMSSAVNGCPGRLIVLRQSRSLLWTPELPYVNAKVLTNRTRSLVFITWYLTPATLQSAAVKLTQNKRSLLFCSCYSPAPQGHQEGSSCSPYMPTSDCHHKCTVVFIYIADFYMEQFDNWWVIRLNVSKHCDDCVFLNEILPSDCRGQRTTALTTFFFFFYTKEETTRQSNL